MMKSKMMASGGMSKMMSSGGAMKTKMMASGGAMPMKDGKPAFLNDGKGMAKGGMHKMPDGKMMKDSAMTKGKMPPALAKHAAMKASKAHQGLAGGGMAKMMTSGGSASKRADGIAQKGKTKGKMMAKGGKAC